MLCKRCENEFTPSPGFVNYCSPKCRLSPNSVRAGWNKGIKGSTGNHQGANNSIHLMDPVERLKLNRQKLTLARQAIEDNKEEVARKKSESMQRAIAQGFRPQDNAGWGGGGRPQALHVEYKGAFMSQEMCDHLNKESNGL